jgi:hypothetical protein
MQADTGSGVQLNSEEIHQIAKKIILKLLKKETIRMSIIG